MSKFTENDVLIVISHSGRTQSLYEVAKCARLNKAKIIAITNYPFSPIAKLVDAVILTASFSPNIYNEIMAKRIPELSVIEALYINILLCSDPMRQAILSNSSKALSLNKIE
jgi:RpiR family carbohydrate utilization transcriptional regulator